MAEEGGLTFHMASISNVGENKCFVIQEQHILLVPFFKEDIDDYVI